MYRLNYYWENTSKTLKYLIVFVIFIVVSYFTFSKKLEDTHIREINEMRVSIKTTYKLIDNFDKFKKEQNEYNEEIIDYLDNLHILVNDLNETTNSKLDDLLSSSDDNSERILQNILLLNESLEKILEVYNKEPGKSYSK